MAVYRRGYQRYQGPLTSPASRLLVLPRFAWERLMQQRLISILFIVALFWPTGCALFIYLSHHLDLLQGMAGAAAAKIFDINAEFFFIFMNAQATFAIILAAFAGPSLIAPDLSNGALPLYFSRPMSRSTYVFSRMLVLVGVLSPVTWIPGALLFLMQSGMAGWDWFIANWHIGAAIVAGFFFWILLVSLVAMASSAYVKWRVVAGALVLAFFFLLAGAAEMVNSVFRVDWASAINPGYAINAVWKGLLDVEIADDKPGAWECATVILGLSGGLLALLARKLRAVEVVK